MTAVAAGARLPDPPLCAELVFWLVTVHCGSLRDSEPHQFPFFCRDRFCGDRQRRIPHGLAFAFASFVLVTRRRVRLTMARLRLGYTKSRTGCLRCKQRRVKVSLATRFVLFPTSISPPDASSDHLFTLPGLAVTGTDTVSVTRLGHLAKHASAMASNAAFPTSWTSPPRPLVLPPPAPLHPAQVHPLCRPPSGEAV